MSSAQATDLKTVLARGAPLDPARAVSVVRQIAAALDDAHANHAVHRDITPANILLSGQDGQGGDYAYLADIGAATAESTALPYRAPELLGNNEVTYRADIYALAGVLYECLTGSPPYPGITANTDAPTLITAHLAAPIPRPSELRLGVPIGFDGVIARGMAKNPADRYRNAGELAAAAQAALTPTPHATPSSRPTTPQATPPGAAPPGAVRDGRTAEPVVPPASPRREQLGWDPAVGRSPMVSSPHSQPPPPPPKRRRRTRRVIAVAIAVIAVIGAVAGTAIAIPHLTQHAATTPTPHTYTSSKPTALQFSDLYGPVSVAVDGSGSVYVLSTLASDSRDSVSRKVLKLAPGATSATMVDFPGVDIRSAEDLAVDAAGSVYAAGSLSGEGDLRYGVKKLELGATRPTDLPFTDLYLPKGLAADKAGDVYVGTDVKDKNTGRIFHLAAGAATPEEVRIPGLKAPARIALDAAGNLFVGEEFGRVLELPAGATSPLQVPFHAKTAALAIDSAGNIYVAIMTTTDKSDRTVIAAQVFKLGPDS